MKFQLTLLKTISTTAFFFANEYSVFVQSNTPKLRNCTKSHLHKKYSNQPKQEHVSDSPEPAEEEEDGFRTRMSVRLLSTSDSN
jgi:hypothetical protein